MFREQQDLSLGPVKKGRGWAKTHWARVGLRVRLNLLKYSCHRHHMCLSPSQV